MIYLYRCECGNEQTIEKPMSECSTKELCKCGKEMQRVYTASAIKTTDGYKI